MASDPYEVREVLHETFERTSCDCDRCKIPCRHMPGALIPGDLDAIADHMGTAVTDDWVDEHFVASDGAKVFYQGLLLSIPSMVPRQNEDGSCHFLDEEGYCTIHRVAPFSCAYHDLHMGPEEGGERSNASIHAQLADAVQRGLHSRHVDRLIVSGKQAPPLMERRGNFERALEEYDLGQEEDEEAGGGPGAEG